MNQRKKEPFLSHEKNETLIKMLNFAALADSCSKGKKYTSLLQLFNSKTHMTLPCYLGNKLNYPLGLTFNSNEKYNIDEFMFFEDILDLPEKSIKEQFNNNDQLSKEQFQFIRLFFKYNNKNNPLSLKVKEIADLKFENDSKIHSIEEGGFYSENSFSKNYQPDFLEVGTCNIFLFPSKNSFSSAFKIPITTAPLSKEEENFLIDTHKSSPFLFNGVSEDTFKYQLNIASNEINLLLSNIENILETHNDNHVDILFRNSTSHPVMGYLPGTSEGNSHEFLVNTIKIDLKEFVKYELNILNKNKVKFGHKV